MTARHTTGALVALSALICGLLAGCGNEDGAAATTDAATTDAGEWWAVDAGTNGGQDGGQDDGTANDAGTASGVDQTCYDACIKKGQPKSVCEPACSKGGGTSGDLDKTCYDACIKKGQPKSVCEPACSKGGGSGDVDKTCYDACIKKGADKDTCTEACPAKGSGDVDKTCYDACIKKGADKDTCTKACPAQGGGATCYDSCIKKGGSQSLCKTGCTCYADCVKEGKGEATCSSTCFAKDPGSGTGGGTYKQPCYDDCLKKGESKDVCAKACPAEALKADWATVHAQIIKPTCAGGYCHGGGSGSLKLTGDAKADHAALTGGTAGSQDAASCGASAYVVPGKPDQSLLWLKVDAKASHGCGKKMPSGKDGLDAKLSGLIKDWITAGAKG